MGRYDNRSFFFGRSADKNAVRIVSLLVHYYKTGAQCLHRACTVPELYFTHGCTLDAYV